MSAWRSPLDVRPPSIGTFAGIGYGPLSDSPAYPNLTPTFFWSPATVVYGMPMGPPLYLPEPKSGWRPVLRPMERTIAAERLATGRWSTRWFQGFDLGKRRQWGAPLTGWPGALATNTAAATAATAPATRGTRMDPDSSLGRRDRARADRHTPRRRRSHRPFRTANPSQSLLK